MMKKNIEEKLPVASSLLPETGIREPGIIESSQTKTMVVHRHGHVKKEYHLNKYFT